MYSKEEIRQFLEDSKKYLTSKPDIRRLRELLRFHEYRYYVVNDPLLSDEEYDKLYKKLEALEREHPEWITPDSPTQRVGKDLNDDFVTVKHLAPMLSLENSYNPQDVIDWRQRLNSFVKSPHVHFSVEPKYDGAGISLIYENDLLVRGTTRGDGAEGDDITTNIRQIRSVPLSASFSKYGIRKIEIRGEILLTKENFRRFNEELMKEGAAPLANPRNAAAGSLRMKDPAEVGRRRLEAVLYHVSYVEYSGEENKQLSTHSGTIEVLNALGFKTPQHDIRTYTDINKVVEYCLSFETGRDNLPYEIDGMVVKVDEKVFQNMAGSTSHHPRWAMAFKFKARQATTKLKDVEFQVGRTGAVTPVAKLEPVHIGGVTVSSVSLFNEGIIQEKDLRIGDTVIVERAGDVIPYIVKPLTELRDGSEKKIHFPTYCPVCGDKLVKPEGEAVWRCMNINCPAQVVERIIHFASKDAMDIKSLGESNVRRFYEEKIITDIPSLYSIDYNRLSGMEGFGKKSIENLQTAIENSKTQELNRLIYGLGIRYVGEATAKELASNVEDLSDLQHFDKGRLQSLKDIGPRVSESIYSFFHDDHNLKMLQELRHKGVNMKGVHKQEATGSLAGKTFLFTGTLEGMKRRDAEKLAEDNGGRLLSSVSAHLDYLVVGEAAGSKLEKARKIKSIQILNEKEFLDLMNHSK
ncbi:MAG: NAD-dependent DNA ligase LigA [Chitinophagaceae bacterium]|nr:NAD-dependent DNA ligase LigA [Chitinophagaceae bacterium]